MSITHLPNFSPKRGVLHMLPEAAQAARKVQGRHNF